MSDKVFTSTRNELLEFKKTDIKIPDESGSKTWDDFQIGNGGFATVYEVQVQVIDNEANIRTKSAAFKRFKKKFLAEDEEGRAIQLQKMKREASLVHRMSHPNIINLLGVCYEEHFFGIILELCEGGSLGYVCRSIKKTDILSQRVITNWALQIARGMEYLAKSEYVHRDLKADNVLVLEHVCYCNESEYNHQDFCSKCKSTPLNKLQLKITDFGLSKSNVSAGDTLVGTPAWVAPEVYESKPGNSNWTESSDIWAFGVVLWEILAREMPYAGAHAVEAQAMVRNGQTLPMKESWPGKWREIINDCWSRKSAERPRFSKLVEHFEQYTSGLVEMHVSDLKRERVIKKRPRSLKDKLIFSWKQLLLCITLSLLFCLSWVVGFSFFQKSNYLNLQWEIDEAETEDCSRGYTYFNSTLSCYKVYDRRSTFEEATAQCASDNAYLLSIHSYDEHAFAVQFFEKSVIKNVGLGRLQEYSTFWLGITQSNSSWKWSDESPMSYEFWIDFRNLGDGQDWAVVDLDDYLHKHAEIDRWKPVGTPNYFPFICKKPNATITLSPSFGDPALPIFKMKKPVNSSLRLCTDGYTVFENNCYKMGADIVSFKDAKENCEQENATVVSIHSMEENVFVIELVKKSYHGERLEHIKIYIGLTYSNNRWEWADGSDVDFVHWNAEEPNYVYTDSKKSEFSTAITFGNTRNKNPKHDGWNNIRHTTKCLYVCKKKAV